MPHASALIASRTVTGKPPLKACASVKVCAAIAAIQRPHWCDGGASFGCDRQWNPGRNKKKVLTLDKTHCRDADNRGFQRFFASDPRLMRIQDAAKLPEHDYLAG